MAWWTLCKVFISQHDRHSWRIPRDMLHWLANNVRLYSKINLISKSKQACGGRRSRYVRWSKGDFRSAFNDIIRRIAAAVGGENELKCRIPVMQKIIRSLKTALDKDIGNFCLKAHILYMPKSRTNSERKRQSRERLSVEYREAEKCATAARNKKGEKQTQNSGTRDA